MGAHPTSLSRLYPPPLEGVPWGLGPQEPVFSATGPGRPVPQCIRHRNQGPRPKAMAPLQGGEYTREGLAGGTIYLGVPSSRSSQDGPPLSGLDYESL